MKQLIPYLIIAQQCEAALKFYQHVFKGDVIFLQRYKETNYQVSKDFEGKIAHAEFKAEGLHFYISDGFEGQTPIRGSMIALSVTFDTAIEQRSVFNKLKEGGTVTLDFAVTSVDSTLVTLTDRYGINWYLNYS